MQFYPKLIIRTPALPFREDLSEDFIKELLHHSQFQEAIYLASPVLYQEALHWRDGQLSDSKKIKKLSFALSKYYSRMGSRCTPFGLFAGCAVVAWGEENKLTLSPTHSQRHTRLDMMYACALAQKLAEQVGIREHLLYFPNSSLYQVGDELRYIEYNYVNGRRVHQISAITTSPYIEKVLELAQTGVKPAEIIPHIINDEISEADILNFMDELIASQILVHELEPAITGEEFTKQILRVLDKLNAEGQFSAIIQLIQKVETYLEAIDNQTINDVSAYQNIIEMLKPLGVGFEEGKLFQTDLVKVFEEKTVAKTFQNDLLEALEILTYFAHNERDINLKNFKKNFSERYEEREMPLLTVLDTETGIGYTEQGKGNRTPLADGINLPKMPDTEVNFKHNLAQQWLFEQWQNAIKTGAYQIEITKEQLAAFKPENQKPLPPSMPVVFRVVNETQLYLESCGGSSAANLLGRFAHADTEIEEVVCQITEAEQAQNPAILFAEIVHLPETRVGNVLLHPVFRSYEIPYLAKSSLPTEQQIPLQDLRISYNMREDKLVLRSEKLNKEIVPRLSNAHNFVDGALPVYQFLGELQVQGLTPYLGFSWKAIVPNVKFTPRVIFKNVILELATWNLKKADFEHLINAKEEELLQQSAQFCQQWQLPQFFVLADADNELLVNTKNSLSLNTWLDAIKNRPTILLKEFLFDEKEALVSDGVGGKFTHQLVGIVAPPAPRDSPPTPRGGATIYPINMNKAINSSPFGGGGGFCLGSEWLYYKLYCGIKSADKILTEAIKPLIDELLAKDWIDKWFFIRYNDPDKHIRLRFHIPDLSHLGDIITLTAQYLKPFQETEILQKIMIDTYQRELERYGTESIEYAETLFYHDSTAILAMLDQTWGDERENIRWLWGMKQIDAFLSDFGYTLAEKCSLLEWMKESFAKEFGMNKELKLQLDQRYRDNRANITRILNPTYDDTHEYAPLFEAIRQKSRNSHATIARLKPLKNEQSLNKFMSDAIHMTVNRLIMDSQRLHELLMYDFLFRQYQSMLAMERKG